MLQTIRDRASGWFAYAIILLISIPFALWGVNNYLNGGGKQVAVKVGGTSISVRAFAQAYQQEQMRLQRTFGGQLPAGLSSKSIKQIVLSQLVRDAVFHQAVTSAGYQTTNRELLEQLMQFPAFQINGKFSRNRYLQVLQAQGMAPAPFESRLRRLLAINQMQSGIQQTAFATTGQAATLLRLQDERRLLSYAVIPAARFAGSVRVDPKQVKAYYSQHKSQYMTPEKVRLAYLRLNLVTLEKGITATPAKIKQYFLAHRTQFAQPARATAREIVVDLTGTDQAKAVARLKAVAAGLAKGENFASLARRYSQAPSAKKGGLVGEITHADLPNAVANALFALKPGQVTPPIKSGHKVYRLKLETLHRGSMPSFESVKAKVRMAYVKSVAQQRFSEESRRLANLTYQNPGSLGPAAKALGVNIEHTGWITQKGGQGLASNPKVMKAAFSTTVLKDGSNSHPLQLGKHDVLVIRALQHKAPEQKSLEQVRNQIHAVLANQAAEKQAEQNGKALIAKVNKVGVFTTVLKGEKLDVHEPGWVGRSGAAGIPAAVVQAAFGMHAPANKKSTFGGVRLQNGNYAVLAVEGIKRPSPDAKKVANARKGLGNVFGQIELQIVYQALEHADSIKVYPNNLNF